MRPAACVALGWRRAAGAGAAPPTCVRLPAFDAPFSQTRRRSWCSRRRHRGGAHTCIWLPFPCASRAADPSQILVQQATAGLLRPAWVLVRDDGLRKVMLCIRGTQSMKDLFTSLTGGCLVGGVGGRGWGEGWMLCVRGTQGMRCPLAGARVEGAGHGESGEGGHAEREGLPPHLAHGYLCLGGRAAVSGERMTTPQVVRGACSPSDLGGRRRLYICGGWPQAPPSRTTW